jgi:hypothetical protein
MGVDHQPAPLGTPAQFAVLVPPAMSALDHPPAADLDPSGQHLPPRPVVVAGVQMYDRPLGQRAEQPDGVQGDGQQTVVAVVGGAGVGEAIVRDCPAPATE